MSDFYRAIGLDPKAPPHVLGGRIADLMSRTPPGPDRDYLHQAWLALSDSENKAAYDAWLFGPTSRPVGEQFMEYVKRFVGLGEVSLSPRERAQLDRAGVRSATAERLLAWRRATLTLLLPLLVVYVVFGAYQTFGSDNAGLNGFGVVMRALPVLAMVGLTIVVVIAVVRWTDLGSTNRLLFWAWLVSTALPLVSFLFPVDWYLDLSEFEDVARAHLDSILRQTWIISVAATVLPVLLSLVSGVLRGVRRAKQLLPTSTLPGWFLGVVAPFYIVVLLAAYSVMSSALDNAAPMIGVLLIAAAPLVWLLYRKRYVTPLTHADAVRTLQVPSLIATACTFCGALVLAIYALTGEVLGKSLFGSASEYETGGAWASYLSLPETMLQVFVRFSITSVVMTVMFVLIIRSDRNLTMAMNHQVRAEYEEEWMYSS